MDSRIVAYVLGVLALVALRLAAVRHARLHPVAAPIQSEAASPGRLFLASFLVLFAELAFIRWIAVEVRIFAYFKNLALLLCFLGFGLGCALVAKPARWRNAVISLFGLLLVVRMPWFYGEITENLSQNLGAATNISIWGAYTASSFFEFSVAVALSAILFLLLIWIFVPLGQEVGRQMNLAPKPLPAYSLNLAASLAGILAFLAVSSLMLPPWVWLGVVVLGFALLQKQKHERILLVCLIVPLTLILHDSSDRDHYSIWTPYQEIRFSRNSTPSGEYFGGLVQVNHIGYQFIVNLTADFLARHPHLLREPVDENPYNLPFRFAAPSPSVLVVGAGTGNDVAAALRHDSSAIDAVEIDPAILAIGKKEHPEHPYDSPKVSVHLTDARAFLKRSPRQYDLILMGLLDSHTQLSDYSNMRVDNFVYTEESFREAKAHLKPDGLLFLKFEVRHPWMVQRFREMLTSTFGKEPVTFTASSSYTASARCFVISASDRVQQALSGDRRLADFVARNPVDAGDATVPATAVPATTVPVTTVPVTTDDWPYLYQRDKTIPRPYWSVSAIIILLSLALYRQVAAKSLQRPESFLFFFSMGAGFLCLETQVISRVALFFGTTWQVNGIVISAMLAALLLANFIVERSPRLLPPVWNLAALLAGLALAFWFPFEQIAGPPAVAGMVAVAVFSIPVVFAGVLFAGQFRQTQSQSAALGANLLGAVAGGLMENLSLVFGMRALLLIAMGLYALAGLGLWRKKAFSS